jgi:hypothetical protein
MDRHRVGFGFTSEPEIRVEYTVAGRRYTIGLAPVWATRDTPTGDILALYVESSDPNRATSTDKFVSEDRYALPPTPIGAIGIVVTILVRQPPMTI